MKKNIYVKIAINVLFCVSTCCCKVKEVGKFENDNKTSIVLGQEDKREGGGIVKFWVCQFLVQFEKSFGRNGLF